MTRPAYHSSDYWQKCYLSLQQTLRRALERLEIAESNHVPKAVPTIVYWKRRAGRAEIQANALEKALRIIALSYKYRIDRRDKEPWEFAQDTLKQLGIDIEKIQDEDCSTA